MTTEEKSICWWIDSNTLVPYEIEVHWDDFYGDDESGYQYLCINLNGLTWDLWADEWYGPDNAIFRTKKEANRAAIRQIDQRIYEFEKLKLKLKQEID